MALPQQHPEAVLQSLLDRLERLEARLREVENRLGISASDAASGEPLPPVSLAGEGAFSDTGVLAGLAGKSLLGLAAAYLLRALTESGILAPAAGVGLGLLYALAWLVWAAGAPASEHWTILARALTSALILGPLLWEAHFRLAATGSWQTAAVLVVFSSAALLVSWKKNQTAVALVGSLAGLLLSAAFLIRTHDLLPYTAALLALSFGVEVSACLDHYLGERWIVAFVTDLAVLLLVFVASRPPGSLDAYPPVSPLAAQLTLASIVTIYLASTMVRTLGRRCRISAFEILQAGIAVAISVWGAVAVSGGHAKAVFTAGLACVLGGAICYVVSFAFLERRSGNDRNFHTYATFGFVLVLAGSWLAASGVLRVLLWSLLAAGFVLAGRESGRMMLKLHAGIYVSLAVVVSGLAGRANSSFLSPAPGELAGGGPAFWVAAAGAVGAHALYVLSPIPERCTAIHALAGAILGASAAWAAAGAAAIAAVRACRQTQPLQAFCPTLLMAILVLLAALAAAGFRRFARQEMRWMAWLLTGVATFKLVSQDLRQAPAFALVLSLLLYGALLVWLPRWLRSAGSDTSATSR
jgi:hypothetical protein